MEVVERAVGVNGSADERPQAADASELLQVRGVFKSFGGTQALADVGMTLKAGEIRCAARRERRRQVDADQDSGRRLYARRGSVSFRGVDVTHALRRLPIAFIHQDLGLIDWMTVAENICLTLGYPRRLGIIDWTRRAAARRPRLTRSAPTSIPTCASRI